MNELTAAKRVIRFHARPKSVPGDLRISWRLSTTLLSLLHSRNKRASFIKLHILNGALLSNAARKRLIEFLDNDSDYDACNVRIEPAFSRNLDILVGKGLAEWLVTSQRLSVQMTSRGLEVADLINSEDELFSDEKEFLETAGRRVTEQRVQKIVSLSARWRI